MTPRSLVRCLGAVALAIGAACHHGSSGPGPETLTNLGIAASSLSGVGDFWVFQVRESQQDMTDLNGDGDTEDTVLFVYDLGTGDLRNLALAHAPMPGPIPLFPAPVFAMGSVLVAFSVTEALQGDTDLNGDGDTDDNVLHVYDHRTGVVTNLALAAAEIQPTIAEGFVAFAVLEAAQGEQDLDGDGTHAGSVLHVYDSRTQLANNAARHLSSVPVFMQHGFAFTTSEVFAGDRNGDGDDSDGMILQLYDLLIGSVQNIAVAVLGPPLGSHHEWVTLVSEAGEGADLNGDGDSADGVYHELDPDLGTVEPIGLSSNQLDGSVGTHDHVALVVQEIDGFDRNGDGDFSDSILVVYSPHTNAVFDTGLAIDTGALRPVLIGEQVAVAVDEDAHRRDLNGDGDRNDAIVHVIDPELERILDLGIDATELHAAGRVLGITRVEAATLEDWNGDGDQDDVVVFLWDPLSASLTNTRVACWGGALAVSDESVLLVDSEEGERRDLNGDGDRLDHVFVLHDLATHSNRSLGFAGSGAGLTADGRGVFVVDEAEQGVDLNGDGDLDDAVLHTLE